MNKKISIGKKKVMVTPITDYYGTNKNDSRINTNINENQTYDIGLVEAVGDPENAHWIGHIIFHTKGFGDKVNLLGIGRFTIIDTDLKILVRLDQDINNYKSNSN